MEIYKKETLPCKIQTTGWVGNKKQWSAPTKPLESSEKEML